MVVAALLALAGCSSVTVDGRFVDGLTGEPVAGPFKVALKALSPDAALSCQYQQVEVGADGRFSVPGLCGGTGYRIETDRDDLWLAELDEVPDGGFGSPTDVKVWKAPKGSGVYRYAGGELEVLKTAADVSKVTLRSTGEKILYPDSLQTPAVIGPGEQLVLVGKTTIQEFRFEPLVPAGPRVFGDATTRITMEPWSYVGVRFPDDSDRVEVVKAELDTGKVVDKEKGNRVVRWIASDAVPAGRYGLFKDGDRRMYVVDFGAAPAAPEPEPEGKAGKGKRGKGE